MEKKLFTSESVSKGHPDKLCDQISDAILDACLSQDPLSRVACECLATTNFVVISGEITTQAKVDYEAIARKVINEIGYNDTKYGMDGATCEIKVLIHTQSNDIAQGVDKAIDSAQIGAGDQGIMFGYATNETKGYMPLAISIAHHLVRVATNLKEDGSFKYARPDMKSQVTIDYTHADCPIVDTVLLSIQHDEDYDKALFLEFIKDQVIEPVLKKYGQAMPKRILINPTGRFVIGGPHGDTGLTGRKIIVDTYGGAARHGGGAFSGKDCTKVDRSAAYMARYLAKNIVAAGLASRCEIQLSYAIGVAQPTSVLVETFNTAVVSEDAILHQIYTGFDLSPKGIIDKLNLRQPIYAKTAAYGHFGRQDIELPWETLDDVESFKKLL